MALFCCIPDSDKSLNYLVGMIYGQLIQTLYYVADRKYKGRLPVPVHLLIDEAPNIALPTDNFLPWLSTMRSRNIFCSYIAAEHGPAQGAVQGAVGVPGGPMR